MFIDATSHLLIFLHVLTQFYYGNSIRHLKIKNLKLHRVWAMFYCNHLGCRFTYLAKDKKLVIMPQIKITNVSTQTIGKSEITAVDSVTGFNTA
jgi:hypothetical protein